MNFIRLNKYICNAGICSRRKADKLILAGDIKVNSKIIKELGYKVKEEDIVEYNNRRIEIIKKHIYIVLNKPSNCLCTSHDPEGRRTVMDLLPKRIRQKHPFTVGRLDRNTTGIILITTDGEIAKILMHPSSNITKKYRILLNKDLSTSDFVKIKKGICLEDGYFKVDKIKIDKKNKREVFVEIHSGRNRILRRLFEALNYKIIELDRYNYAGITKNGLKQGEYMFIEDIKSYLPAKKIKNKN